MGCERHESSDAQTIAWIFTKREVSGYLNRGPKQGKVEVTCIKNYSKPFNLQQSISKFNMIYNGLHNMHDSWLWVFYSYLRSRLSQ
jgi:hypothetical protein